MRENIIVLCVLSLPIRLDAMTPLQADDYDNGGEQRAIPHFFSYARNTIIYDVCLVGN